MSWVLKQRKKPIFPQNKNKQWHALPTNQETSSENRNICCCCLAALCTQNYLVCLEYSCTTSDVYAHHGPCSWKIPSHRSNCIPTVIVVHHFHNLHQSKSEVALQWSRAVTSALSLLLNVWVSSVLPWLPTSEGDIHSAAAGLDRHYCKISFSTTLLTMLGIH